MRSLLLAIAVILAAVRPAWPEGRWDVMLWDGGVWDQAAPVTTPKSTVFDYDLSLFGPVSPGTAFWSIYLADSQHHLGVDYNLGPNPSHYDVISPGYGQVDADGVKSGPSNLDGNIVSIRHLLNNGVWLHSNIYHFYPSSIAVRNSQFVARRQILGREGSSGMRIADPDSNVHVHHEFCSKNRSEWSPDTATACPGSDCAREQMTADYDLPAPGGSIPAHYIKSDGAATGSRLQAYREKAWYDPSTVSARLEELIPALSSSPGITLQTYDARATAYARSDADLYGYLNAKGQFGDVGILARRTPPGDWRRENAAVSSFSASLSDAQNATEDRKFLALGSGALTDGLGGSSRYRPGDYLFLAYVHAGGEDRRYGYPVKYTVTLAGESIRDNDQRDGATTFFTNIGGEVWRDADGRMKAHKVPGYYLTSYLARGRTNAFAVWRPGDSRDYEVLVHVPPGATATAVTYKIYPTGEETTPIFSKPVNQAASADRWVRLEDESGNTRFSFTSNGRVGLSLNDAPPESPGHDRNYAIGPDQWVALDAVFFRKPPPVSVTVQASPRQASSATVSLTSQTDLGLTQAQIIQQYNIPDQGMTPLFNAREFTATTSTPLVEATFSYTLDRVEGAVSSLAFYKLCDDNTSRQFTYASSISPDTDGAWWLLDSAGNHLPASAVLERDKQYTLEYVIRDNGRFDQDAAPGVIHDPMVLAARNDGGGSGAPLSGAAGCVADPGKAPGWDMLLLSGLAVAAVFLRWLRRGNAR
ncbi:MAG: M23 family metallopeptidase [Thermodesulfobacteriota bacterium]